ncbi:MAG: DUF4760 domain-containing protein [Pseudomonadota bacterium]
MFLFEFFGSIEATIAALATTAVISLVLAIAAVVQAWYVRQQSRIARKSLLADHEKRQKQATMEHVTRIREVYVPIRNWLDATFGHRNPVQMAVLDDQHDLREDVQRLLGTMEHLAVGALSDVFDLDILDRMSGMFIVRLYQRLEPYIEGRRTDEHAFREFGRLVETIESRRQKQGLPRDLGAITYAPHRPSGLFQRLPRLSQA